MNRRTIRVQRCPLPEGTTKRKRSKRVLLLNEKRAIRSVTKAIDLYGEGEPLIQECLETMMKMARGERGFRGRYIGTRMRAISRMLDTLAGRPREAPPPVGSEDEAKAAIVSLVAGLRGET